MKNKPMFQYVQTLFNDLTGVIIMSIIITSNIIVTKIFFASILFWKQNKLLTVVTISQLHTNRILEILPTL